MKIQGVPVFVPGAQPGAAGSLSLPGGDDFANKLQLGQIIKGRVLRHYGGSRYGVDFNGQEKVVDSAVPLQGGEVLYGKVVGLDDKVELDRVRPSAADAARDAAAAARRSGAPAGGGAAAPEQLPEQLPAQQARLLDQVVRNVGGDQAARLAGTALGKLGIALAPELVKALADLLRAAPGRGLFAPGPDAVELQVGGKAQPGQAASPAAVLALAEVLRQLVEQFPERQAQDEAPAATAAESGAPGPGNPARGGAQQDRPGVDPGRWLLNVQTGGSVGHRINTVPLLVNGRLVELDIAVFEQRQGQREQEPTRHRQLSFSLASEALGQVDASVMLTGSHLRLAIGAARAASADMLASFSPQLMRQLQDDGWQVDEMNYAHQPAGGAGVARTVLEHVAAQDSVSRLV